VILFFVSLLLTLGLVAYGAGYPSPSDPAYGRKLSTKSNALVLASLTSLPLWVALYHALHGVFVQLAGGEFFFHGFTALDALPLMYVGILLGVGVLMVVSMLYNNSARHLLREDVLRRGGEALGPGHPIYDMVRTLTAREGITTPDVYLMPMSVSNIMVTVQGRKRVPIIMIDTKLADQMTPDELAAVLLHELGHVKNRDIDRSMVFQVTGGLMAGMAIIYGLLSVTFAIGWGPITLAFIFSWIIARVFNALLVAASSRRNEFHADYFSARRMDPQFLVSGLFIVEEAQRAFYRSKGFNPDQPVRGLLRYLASHPPASARYAVMRELRALYHTR
jgi:Zn-dependent protease with chaperone function